jgi:Tfp pilus assembly protein PilF
VDAWIGLGISARDLGQAKEAIAALTQATQLDKNRADAWLNLGLAYEQSGDNQLATQAYRKALSTATDSSTSDQAAARLARIK